MRQKRVVEFKSKVKSLSEGKICAVLIGNDINQMGSQLKIKWVVRTWAQGEVMKLPMPSL